MIQKSKAIASGLLAIIAAATLVQAASSTSSWLQKAHQRIDPNHFDAALLENTLVHFTNLARRKHHLAPCIPDAKLRNAARSHSQEMARLRYFSHESPVNKNHDLVDRMKNAGLNLGNTIMGENIGVDYFLKIAKVPFFKKIADGKTVYIDAETEKPITHQTYREFARRMVDNWMISPEHRKNILNKQFQRIGIGVARGTYRGFKAIYVTQHFIGPINPESQPNQEN